MLKITKHAIFAVLCACLAFALQACFERVSWANGRYPYGTQLVIDPEDANHLVVRTTFGMLQTDAEHAPWTWICEEAIGYSGAFDPAIALVPNGIVAALVDGPSITRDRGCNWARANGPLRDLLVIDLAADRTTPSRVVAITSSTNAQGVVAQAVAAKSEDGGDTWSLLGDLPEGITPTTIDIAPSDPNRIYIAAIGVYPRFGNILRSDNGGATWSQIQFDMRATAPYLSAVDPARSDRIYVRFSTESGSRLSVSDDRGQSFRDIFEANDPLLGFALSPSGETVAIGGRETGLWMADTSTFNFRNVNAIAVSCLVWQGTTLLACADQSRDGFAIGSSEDRGKTFQSRVQLSDVSPRACASSSSAAVCANVWPQVEAMLVGDAGTTSQTDGSFATVPSFDAGQNTNSDEAALPSASANLSVRGGCALRINSISGAISLFLLVVLSLVFVVRRC